jgi:hypothetical protein
MKISKEMWGYKIGAYQVLEEYLKDRKKREMSLEEIGHYMRVAKALKRKTQGEEEVRRMMQENVAGEIKGRRTYEATCY